MTRTAKYVGAPGIKDGALPRCESTAGCLARPRWFVTYFAERWPVSNLGDARPLLTGMLCRHHAEQFKGGL